MSTQPNCTLYINNLNDKVNKEELRSQLYALFTTYGKVVDIVASKSQKMRGQAFLVFADQGGATSAMRACEGIVFYDKPMRISYAKTRSYATLRREDPNFIPPNAVNASPLAMQMQASKRPREETAKGGAERQAKRGRSEEDEEEMEIDEDEESGKPASPPPVPAQVQRPSARLMCTNLPQEITEDMLAVLFQQYQGFQTTQITWSSTPGPGGARSKMAQVFYETPELATVAKGALDGFSIKKGWEMSVVYI